jgi:uncharacterized protein
MINSFPCTQCGACCSSISNVDFLSDYNLDGVCMKLQNNRCSIYESRPLLCRIDDAFDEIFSAYMTKEQYYLTNAIACNELQEKKKIDQRYRININNLK